MYMRVLWVVNIPCLGLGELLGLPRERAGSGGWLVAAIKEFEKKAGVELAIVSTAPITDVRKKQEYNITYYLLGGGWPVQYSFKEENNIRQWQQILDEFKPDLIQLWGTEFPHAMAAINAAKGVPSLIYVQGIKGAIARYYLGGMTPEELKSSRTWKTILFRKGIRDKQKEFYKHAQFEKEIFEKADYVIGENDWCEANCLLLNPNIKYKESHLPINKVFFAHKWKLKEMQRHTIFCNASGYPVKGTHMLLKALAIVKQKYPNVILNIPGISAWDKADYKVRTEGYYSFLHKQIKALDIADNVRFLGMISHEEMANYIERANVYVMSSCIENHSSSLIEAMCVGAPCISSMVGGVHNFVEHKRNGLLYRYDEYPILAKYIMDLFESDLMCEELSRNALATVKMARLSYSPYEELSQIYKSIKRD